MNQLKEHIEESMEELEKRNAEMLWVDDIELPDIKSFLRDTQLSLIQKIIAMVEGMAVDTGIKMYPDKRTGEMRYLHGDSPSSVCIGCGQKKQAEKQGYNAALLDLKSKLKELL